MMGERGKGREELVQNLRNLENFDKFELHNLNGFDSDSDLYRIAICDLVKVLGCSKVG